MSLVIRWLIMYLVAEVGVTRSARMGERRYSFTLPTVDIHLANRNSSRINKSNVNLRNDTSGTFYFYNRWKEKQAEKVLLTNLDCILLAIFGSLSSDAFSLPSRPKRCSVSDVKLKLIRAQRQTIRLGNRVNEKKTNLSISLWAAATKTTMLKNWGSEIPASTLDSTEWRVKVCHWSLILCSFYVWKWDLPEDILSNCEGF